MAEKKKLANGGKVVERLSKNLNNGMLRWKLGGEFDIWTLQSLGKELKELRKALL